MGSNNRTLPYEMREVASLATLPNGNANSIQQAFICRLCLKHYAGELPHQNFIIFVLRLSISLLPFPQPILYKMTDTRNVTNMIGPS